MNSNPIYPRSPDPAPPEADERELEDLTMAEQRERLDEMSHVELVDLTIDLLFDIERWRGRYGRLCIYAGIENIYREKA